MQAENQLIQKSAVRFAKTGRAIYHSHHDMIRLWERLIRRAKIPVRLTQGFNPRPRLVFPHALGLGISSRLEVVELELAARLDNREIFSRLSQAASGTLEILDVHTLPPVKASRQILASSYRLSGWTRQDTDAVKRAAAGILLRREIMVERGVSRERRSLDIRPFIAGVTVASDGNDLELSIHHTQRGSARPDEIVRLLAGAIGRDGREWSIEKIRMKLG
jgi:radical SAM-linked protein